MKKGDMISFKLSPGHDCPAARGIILDDIPEEFDFGTKINVYMCYIPEWGEKNLQCRRVWSFNLDKLMEFWEVSTPAIN